MLMLGVEELGDDAMEEVVVAMAQIRLIRAVVSVEVSVEVLLDSSWSAFRAEERKHGSLKEDLYMCLHRLFAFIFRAHEKGMVLLTLNVSLPSLRPPPCGQLQEGSGHCDNQASPIQVGVFYTALYIVALGIGGTKPNISTMGASQFDHFEPNERKQELSFFNWWMFRIFFSTLFANTVLVCVQDNIGSALGYGVPIAELVVSITVFIVETPYYRDMVPSVSPFTRIARVLVAAMRKWRMALPNKALELYELSSEYY